MTKYYNEIYKILESELQMQRSLLAETMKFPYRYPKVINSCKEEIKKLEGLMNQTLKIMKDNNIK